MLLSLTLPGFDKSMAVQEIWLQTVAAGTHMLHAYRALRTALMPSGDRKTHSVAYMGGETARCVFKLVTSNKE